MDKWGYEWRFKVAPKTNLTVEPTLLCYNFALFIDHSQEMRSNTMISDHISHALIQVDAAT